MESELSKALFASTKKCNGRRNVKYLVDLLRPILIVAVALVSTTAANVARADSYPTQAIRIIVALSQAGILISPHACSVT